MRKSKNLSKRITEILSTASPRQKALLICKDWTDRNTMRKEPLLTEEEALAIRDSLSTNDEKREYNKWLHHYNVYNDITPLIGIVYKEYQATAEQVLGYLKMWEAYIQEENHLNTIYQGILDTGLNKAIDKFGEMINCLYFDGAKLTRDKDGYIEIELTELYERIKSEVAHLTNNYKVAKAIVIVMEEYIKKTRSKAFLPDITQMAIDNIKEDYALNVAPQYSRKVLQENIDKGVRVTKEERLKAVYPSYDEIQPDSDIIEMFRQRLSNIERNAE